MDADIAAQADMWKKSWNSMESSVGLEEAIRYYKCSVPAVSSAHLFKRALTVPQIKEGFARQVRVQLSEPETDCQPAIGLYTSNSDIYNLDAPYQPLYAIG